METIVLELPLYKDPDYAYIVSLQGRAYKIRLYYNERMSRWIFNLAYADGAPIVTGEALSLEYPLFLDYGVEDLTGYFYLSPIGKKQNNTELHPFELQKYYKLYYVYEEQVK